MQLAGLYVGQFLFRESFSERKKKKTAREETNTLQSV